MARVLDKQQAAECVTAFPDSRAVGVRPNLFLVGAPKAGTTSVDRLLRGHPEVFLSPIKEPCHFCSDVAEQIERKGGRMRRIDMRKYLTTPVRSVIHLAWVTSADDYMRLFEGSDGRKVVGECSTYYLSSARAPGNIRACNPEAKIVIVLRNPIDRIRSHYAMDLSLGTTDRPLLALIEEELALGDAADWSNCQFYVGASRYARQIEAFRRHFEPERICVLSFEALVADPDAELRRLFEFLGIAAPSGPLALPRENRSRAARFRWLHHGLRRSGLKPLVSSVLRAGRMEGLMKSAYYRRDTRSIPDNELRTIERLLRDEGLATTTDAAAMDRS